MFNHKNLLDANTTIFSVEPIYIRHVLCLNAMEKVEDLTTLTILRTPRAMLMNSCLLILRDFSFLFGCAEYCACFNKFLPVKRLKIILKDRKSQLLSVFRCQDIPKN